MRVSRGWVQSRDVALAGRCAVLWVPMKHFAAACVGLVLAVLFIIRLIQVDRGIDLTDEMMYLLAASAGPTDFIHSMWGWHTAPLLRITQGDVASFRSLGVLVLAFTAAVGALVARASFGSTEATLGSSWQHYTETFFLAAGAAFWSSLFYIGMLRSPGHNWVAVVGLTLSAAGLMALLSESGDGFGWSGPLLVGVGCTLVLPSRPLSVIPLALVVLVRAVQLRHEDRGQQVFVRVAGSAIGLVALALAIGAWPLSVVYEFARAAGTPSLVESSTIGGALVDYSMFPIDWARRSASMARANPEIGLLLLALFITALILRRLEIHQESAGRTVVRFVLAVAPMLAIMVAGVGLALRPSLGGLGYASSVWGTIAIGSVVFAVLLTVLSRSGASAGNSPQVGLTFVALAAAGGIGTAGNLIGISGNSLGIIGLALLVVALGEVNTSTQRTWISVAWSVTGVVLAVALLSAGTTQPYRMLAFAQQDEEVRILNGALYVDSTTAARLRELRQLSEQSGFEPGDQLIAVTLPWSSFAPVALDAERMPSLLPTVFGYPGTVEMAEFNLSLLNGEWQDAWIIVDNARGSELYRERAHQVKSVEELLVLATGREFPSGYTCVAAGEHFQIWYPAQAEARVCSYMSPGWDSN